MSGASHPSIFPALRYRDAAAALEWLPRAFGFLVKTVYRDEDNGTIAHAELQLGTGLIMFGQDDDRRLGGNMPDPRASTVSIYVVVEDPDAHYAGAKAAGAQIVRGLTDGPYGSRQYSARDLEGNLWSFGTYDPCA